MSGNLENDRSVTTGKMYPIDLAPQKITIVKSVSNTEVKMAHLIPGQPKTTTASQLITHSAPVGLMRPTAQILSQGVTSQPQMIVTGSPLLQGTQIVTQGSQNMGQSSQIISQSQIISPSGQILSPGTQIISQGTQLTAVSSGSNSGSSNVQVSVPSSASGQVLSVGGLVSGGQALVSGTANLVVSSSVRTLPPSVRVLPPLPHHNSRPATAVLSSVNVSSTGGVLVNKGVTSHVPRGLAAGASLAVRPATPAAASALGGRGRGALVYGARGVAPRAAAPRAAVSAPPAGAAPAAVPVATVAATQAQHSAVVTLPATTVLTSTGVISGTLRAATPTNVATRPLPLLQRNYQPKVVGVASVGVRGVGNSAPTQLYYEVPRAQPTSVGTQIGTPPQHVANQHGSHSGPQHTGPQQQHIGPQQHQHVGPQQQHGPSQHVGPQQQQHVGSQQHGPLQHVGNQQQHGLLSAQQQQHVGPQQHGPSQHVGPKQQHGLLNAQQQQHVGSQQHGPMQHVGPQQQHGPPQHVGPQQQHGPSQHIGPQQHGPHSAQQPQHVGLQQHGPHSTQQPQHVGLQQHGPHSAQQHGPQMTTQLGGPLGQSHVQISAPASLTAIPRPLTPYAHAQPAQVSVVSGVQSLSETRSPASAVVTSSLPRPTILRKRDMEGSPTKTAGVGPPNYTRTETWDDVPSGGGDREGSGGSTTMSASSSPAPDDEPEPPRIEEVSPRKKPRKQMLSSEVRQCQEFQREEIIPTPPPIEIKPPKRPLLSSSYVCGWRSTALHFTRPSDVRRREPRVNDILQIACQKHVLTSAEGWKVHHLTAQMDDLVSLEADAGAQLTCLLRALEALCGRAQHAHHAQHAQHALAHNSHALLELLKGNIQRSKIVSEGIQEAREDILRVFTHRNFVSDILTRQADKRCYRTHRSQS